MIKTKTPYAAALLLAVVVAGCQCNGPGTKRREASIEEEKTLLEFGDVQVNFEHERTLRITSAGASALEIVELRVSEPFGVRDAVPLSISSGDTLLLTVTFKPTEVGKRELGKLVILSNDPERPEVTITLQGTGIQAAAVATPNPLDFGDVYQGESKTLTLTVHNEGSNQLEVVRAEFLPDTPADVTGDLASISQNVPAGGSTQTEITFKPTQRFDAIPGGIRLTLHPLQGSDLVIPFTGRGTRSMPQLCWQFDGQGTATCTAVAAALGSPDSNLPVKFPALCDRSLYPADGGTNPCGDTPYEMSGQLYVRNEGNVPIKYSLNYAAAVPSAGCDGGTITDPDFRFSNAPSPNTISWPEQTVTLPPGMESAPVTLTYRPTAGCASEASDGARVLWMRQGDLAEQKRHPSTLGAFFSGQSRLPHAVPSDVTFNLQGDEVTIPHVQAFTGVMNKGIADFQVTKVTLYEAIDPNATDRTCAGPDAGIFQACVPNPVAASDCYYFGWADGGHPNATAPHTIPFSTDGGTATAVIGQLAFSPAFEPDGGAPLPVLGRCVYAVIETTDPFHRKVISEIKATFTP